MTERHRLTLIALAQVDSGETIEHEAVKAWATSLGSDKPMQPPPWHTREER
jgi:hypothetical protein